MSAYACAENCNIQMSCWIEMPCLRQQPANWRKYQWKHLEKVLAPRDCHSNTTNLRAHEAYAYQRPMASRGTGSKPIWQRDFRNVLLYARFRYEKGSSGIKTFFSDKCTDTAVSRQAMRTVRVKRLAFTNCNYVLILHHWHSTFFCYKRYQRKVLY